MRRAYRAAMGVSALLLVSCGWLSPPVSLEVPAPSAPATIEQRGSRWVSATWADLPGFESAESVEPGEHEGRGTEIEAASQRVRGGGHRIEQAQLGRRRRVAKDARSEINGVRDPPAGEADRPRIELKHGIGEIVDQTGDSHRLSRKWGRPEAAGTGPV